MPIKKSDYVTTVYDTPTPCDAARQSNYTIFVIFVFPFLGPANWGANRDVLANCYGLVPGDRR